MPCIDTLLNHFSDALSPNSGRDSCPDIDINVIRHLPIVSSDYETLLGVDHSRQVLRRQEPNPVIFGGRPIKYSAASVGLTVLANWHVVCEEEPNVSVFKRHY